MAGAGRRDQWEGDPLPEHGPILSIDWGTKRIGVALSDPDQTIAHPVGVLSRRAGRRFPLKQLHPIIEEHHPSGVLVGLPLEPDGSDGESAVAAREAAQVIREKTRLPVHLLDERMTTARVIKEMDNGSGQGGGRSRDELAAVVLLQIFLERRRA